MVLQSQFGISDAKCWTAKIRSVWSSQPRRTTTSVALSLTLPVYSQVFFEVNYPDLASWLQTIPNAPRDAFITFGPGLSYFACAPRYGSIWAGIPTDMSVEVQRAPETPSSVSLGMNGAWFVMWPDGHYAWKFYGSYPALDKILNAAEERSIEVCLASANLPRKSHNTELRCSPLQ